MSNIVVRYLQGDRLMAEVRGHEVAADQPAADGGEDLAPTPTELFLTGLATCVGFYAERYLRRHDLDPTGLVIECDYDLSEVGPARVSEIRIAVTAPGLPETRREAFARVIEHCTVRNSLMQPPAVTMDLVRSELAA
jgi:putative redox protein